MSIPSIQELLQKHTNELVEASYREKESFILAVCHATGCTPLDFELVETRSRDGLTTKWHIQRRS